MSENLSRGQLELLRRTVRIGRSIREYNRQEYEREVACAVCRDHFVLNVKYLDKDGIDRSKEVRCDCSGARDSRYYQYKSVSLLLDKIEYVVCPVCGTVFRVKDWSDLLTRPHRQNIMEPVCRGCKCSTKFEDELKASEARLERAEGAALAAPRLSKEEMMKRLAEREAKTNG